MYTVEYSILQYSPDLFTDESINVGIAFHVVEENYRHFEMMQRKSRLFSFDDELDKNFTNATLEGIKQDWLNKDSVFDIHKNLSSFTKYYVNEFHFSKIYVKNNLNNFDEFIDETTRYFIGLGLDKSKRLSEKERLNYLAKHIGDGMFPSMIHHTELGKHGDNMHFDLYANSPQEVALGIKILKNQNRNISHLRSWLFFASVNKVNLKMVILLEEPLIKYSDPLKALLKEAEDKKIAKILAMEDIDSINQVATSDNPEDFLD